MGEPEQARIASNNLENTIIVHQNGIQASKIRDCLWWGLLKLTSIIIYITVPKIEGGEDPIHSD